MCFCSFFFSLSPIPSIYSYSTLTYPKNSDHDPRNCYARGEREREGEREKEREGEKENEGGWFKPMDTYGSLSLVSVVQLAI